MKQNHFSYEKFCSYVDVSRETYEKLEMYHDLLLKWQQKINLISPKTIDNAWERHFLDSAQLFSLLSKSQKPIFDLGSGAGFPGLVLSVMGIDFFRLIESDQKKSVFLSEVIRQTQSTAIVWNKRIESLSISTKASVITSRACAPLFMLMDYAYPLIEEDGYCLFMKGKEAITEITEAQKKWMFHVKHHPSQIDSDGCILEIRGLIPLSSQ